MLAYLCPFILRSADLQLNEIQYLHKFLVLETQALLQQQEELQARIQANQHILKELQVTVLAGLAETAKGGGKTFTARVSEPLPSNRPSQSTD